MQGAREYNTALEACAANNVCGFRKFWRSRRDFIVNGHFVFETGEHARGKTLTVYMTDTPLVDKMETAEREEIFKRGLKVYDVVSGQRGWDERYGFVVHGIIEKTVQDMLNAAVHAHANMVACLELRKKAEEAEKARLYSEKVKRFENIIKYGDKTDTDCSTESTPEKDNVSYGGYTFSPVRNFEEEEFKTITKHLRSDRELGFSKYDGAKHLWSYEDFYKACSANKRAQNCDIFYCIETGKYYIPGENELFEYVAER